ncbi:MAG: hypothetical protein BWX80_04085 [Candidatus Hydrogenedentes bacterium ADurb.Bin101]|nr:MAG: hypothetical protein BWX80_04085 [Candidatus Hydrogenedentes bacterium ADurb.Bin101]
MAPRSNTTALPVKLGRVWLTAGRETPGIVPSRILAATMTAPVFPALMTAWASPSLTMRMATRRDDCFFLRTASTGCSWGPILSGACRTWILPILGREDSFSRNNASSPTSTTSTSELRLACTAPSTSTSGGASVPMASTAIRTAVFPGRRHNRRNRRPAGAIPLCAAS